MRFLPYFALLLGLTVSIDSQAQPQFGPGQVIGPYTEFSSPRATAVGDIDGDGYPDIAVAAADMVVWYPNLGDGSFGVHRTIAGGASSIALADMDNDGDADVLVTGAEEAGLSWLENAGPGAFGDRRILIPEVEVTAAAAADFNADGDIEVVAEMSDGDVVLLSKDASGHFVAQTIMNLGRVYRARLIPIDLDGDGDLDLAAGGWYGIEWILNRGALRFETESHTEVSLVSDMAVADMDGDGNDDLIVSTEYSWGSGEDVLRIFLNEGTGAMTAHTVQEGEEFTSIEAIDIDGDGDQDIVAGSPKEWGSADAGLILFENLGDSSWSSNSLLEVQESPATMAAADIDQDGDFDLVTVATTSGSVDWYQNKGGGEFSETPLTPTQRHAIFAITTGDFDSDGLTDIVTTGYYEVMLHKGRQEGTFDEPVQIPIPFSPGLALISGDYDGDGDLDIIAAGDQWSVYLANSGIGVFTIRENWATGGFGAVEVWQTDVDGDGDIDLFDTGLCFGPCNHHQWFEGDGSGSFVGHEITRTISHASTLGDFDGDGDDDVAYAANEEIFWCSREDSGDYNCQHDVVPHKTASLAAADLDGDGDIDLVGVDPSQPSVSWFPNDGSGRFGREEIGSAWAGTVRLADLDGDGDEDLVVSSRIVSPYYYFPGGETVESGHVSWIENLGGGTFGEPQALIEGRSDVLIHLADVNGDGRVDVLTGSTLNSKLTLFENQTVSVAVAPGAALPRTARLHAAYPNPFNPETIITFDLPREETVRLEVLDIMGRRIQVLADGRFPPGTHSVRFEGSHLPSGAYVYRIQAGTFTESRVMAIVK